MLKPMTITHPVVNGGAETKISGTLKVHQNGNEALLTLYDDVYRSAIHPIGQSIMSEHPLELRTEDGNGDGRWKPVSAINRNDGVVVVILHAAD